MSQTYYAYFYVLFSSVQARQNPTDSVKRTYNDMLNIVPVAEAARMPTFEEVRTATYRYNMSS
jgi:hypothetical protein